MKPFCKFIALAALALTPSLAVAEKFPDGPVRVIIPFTPGGSNDTIGRYLGEGLSRTWGEAVVIENRPGAGSAIGSAHVATSAPDGHTLLFVSGTYTTNAATQANLPFDPLKDLQPVGLVALGDRLIATGSRVSLPTLAVLAEKAKTEQIFYGTTGIGSSTQFDTEFLSDVMGIKMTPVHYKGGSDALLDLAGGRLDVYVGSVTGLLPNIESKTAVPVALMSKTRADSIPDVPTVSEAGFPAAETYIWWGVFAPAGTDPEITGKINSDIFAVMATPEAEAFLKKNGLAVPHRLNVQEFTDHVSTEIARWKELAARRNIVAE
jgi:Uncharacterized protein conserved in bacteria